MKSLISLPPRQPDAFARAAFATFVAAAKGSGSDPRDVVARRWGEDRATLAVLGRAAVEPAKTTGWASELTQTAFRAFLAGLEPLSAAARLIPMGVPARLEGLGAAKYPARAGPRGNVPWVAESGAIPVAVRELEQVSLGPAKKIALITVHTHELASRADGEAVLTTLLREDAAATIDAAYFSTAAGSGSAHAGLLHAVTPLPASSAGGREAMLEDLAALASAVAAAGSGQVVFIMATGRAAALPILAPELAITVLPSPSVPADRVIAVDPLALIHATDPAPELFASRSAAVHMDDDPSQIGEAGSPNTVAAPVVSMYQTAQIALRILADIAFAKRRPGAAAYIDGADWS